MKIVQILIKKYHL